MTLTENMEPYFESLKDILVSSVDKLKDYEGIEIKSNDNGKNKIEIVVAFDDKKINDKARSELGFENGISYDSVEKSLKEDGFVCE